MLAAVIFGTLAFGGLCFLFFHCIVYVVPAFVGVTAGLWAFNTGAGPLGATVVAMIAGGTTVGAFRFAYGVTRSLLIRTVVAAVFAAPATYAGYNIILGLVRCCVPSDVWRHGFAVVAAVVIALAAVARLAIPAWWIPESSRSKGEARQTL